jgi:hypothetical protein
LCGQALVNTYFEDGRRWNKQVRDCEDRMSCGIDSLESLHVLPHLIVKYEHETPRVTNRKKASKNYNFSICSIHKWPTRPNSGTVEDDMIMIMHCSV